MIIISKCPSIACIIVVYHLYIVVFILMQMYLFTVMLHTIMLCLAQVSPPV